MIGPVNFEKTLECWQQDKWNGSFSVKWHIIKDLPNSLLRHITLENNENKPVTNSRDTQEVRVWVSVCMHGLDLLFLFSPSYLLGVSTFYIVILKLTVFFTAG